MGRELSQVSNSILDRMERGVEVDPELAGRLASALARQCALAPGVDDCEEYRRLKARLSTALSNQPFEGAVARAWFGLGACWGSVNLAAAMQHEAKRDERDGYRYDLAVKNRKILVLVFNRPGISHGDLAREAGKSASRLTQIMAPIKKEKLVVVSIRGRSRKYSLTPFAEMVVRETASPRPPVQILDDMQAPTHAPAWGGERFRVRAYADVERAFAVEVDVVPNGRSGQRGDGAFSLEDSGRLENAPSGHALNGVIASLYRARDSRIA